METVFFFKNMVRSEETQLQEYVFKKLPRIEKLLTHFAEDAVLLHVKGEKFDKHSAYDVELVLKLPSGTLSGKEASHAITKAVDLAVDRLEMQLKKSSEKVRRGHRSIKARRSLKLQEVSLEERI